MNTREMATEYRLASWAQAMQERVANKETIKEFCLRRGVSRHSYFYWQRRLREAAAKQLEQKASQALVPSGWTAIETAETKVNEAAALPIEIGSCRVLVDSGTDMELLTKVCERLASLC